MNATTETTDTTDTTGSTESVAQTAPAVVGYSHVGLTVRDVEVSEAWYSKVLGLVRAFAEPHHNGDGAGFAVVMHRPNTGLFLGLDHHADADREAFDARRTGLDHVAISVETREALDEWVAYLDTIGVDHEPVFEATEPNPFALVLVRDPDGIPIELFWIGH